MPSRRRKPAPPPSSSDDGDDMQLPITIDRSEVRPVRDMDVNKKDVKLITSYNWVDAAPGQPQTILVPGSPAHWRPKPAQTLVQPDRGEQIIDQNGHRSGHHPLSALILSLPPRFNIYNESIDVVTDRNNLRKLMRFITATNGHPFRILAQHVGCTLLLQRCDEDGTAHTSENFHGYGHNFEREYTRWPRGCEDSASHHRVITYHLGGLRMLVRYEADAALANTDTFADADVEVVGATHISTEIASTTAPVATGGGVNLTAVLAALEAAREEANERSESGIHVRRGVGALMPHSSIIELKSKQLSSRRDPRLQDTLSQLWFSDTRMLAAGYHHHGLFGAVDVLDASGPLDEWEHTNRLRMSSLVKLLRQIIKAVKPERVGETGRCCELLCLKNSRTISVQELPVEGAADGRSRDLLPPTLMAKVAGGGPWAERPPLRGFSSGATNAE